MIQETKRYSDFIKINKIKVNVDGFILNGVQIYVTKDSDGKWYVENDDKCHTKKAAIYYHLLDNCIVENGIIV